MKKVKKVVEKKGGDYPDSKIVIKFTRVYEVSLDDIRERFDEEDDDWNEETILTIAKDIAVNDFNCDIECGFGTNPDEDFSAKAVFENGREISL
jgi:hypothetical protein